MLEVILSSSILFLVPFILVLHYLHSKRRRSELSEVLALVRERSLLIGDLHKNLDQHTPHNVTQVQIRFWGEELEISQPSAAPLEAFAKRFHVEDWYHDAKVRPVQLYSRHTEERIREKDLLRTWQQETPARLVPHGIVS